MTKTPEQEANELVEMFRVTLLELQSAVMVGTPVHIAILHVERLIEVLSKRCSLGGYTRDQIEHYQQVLSILKDKK